MESHRINEIEVFLRTGWGEICVQACKFDDIMDVVVKSHVYAFHKEKCFFPCCRQQIFAAFTEEFLAAPFTDQIFHFIIPALADVQTCFPYELFLNALLLTESRRSRKNERAPWLFYFVLMAGETYLGMKNTFDLLEYPLCSVCI